MNTHTAEVSLTVKIGGEQSTRGSYVYYHKVGKTGVEVSGVTTVRPVTYSDCKKTIKLSNDFVRGAMANPPEDMKHKFSKIYWASLPAAKRLSIHVTSYVRAMHPENRGFTMDILQ